MRAKAAGICISLLMGAGLCLAQEPLQTTSQFVKKANEPDYSQTYCSGFVTDQRVPDEMRLISGEQSNYKITFARGDYVYLNRGMNQGVREGDRFAVVRPVSDPVEVPWFKWQAKLMKAMGTAYSDLGQVRVVKVHPNVSIAEINFSCAYMQRGDIIRPFAERPLPQFKDAGPFDHFAPVSGKAVAMVVAAKDFAQTSGANDTLYINLGTNQGVKVGDYFRIFRYQGTRASALDIDKDTQYKLFGFGGTPQIYKWNDLPREILGEGIVLNVSHNSSTVLVTYSTSEVFSGDYVEVE
jgi:hypothetical protein